MFSLSPSLFVGQRELKPKSFIPVTKRNCELRIANCELFNGWVVRINSAREIEDVVRLYGKLNRTVALFGRVRVLDFDGKAGEMFQRLLTENPTLSKQRLQKDMRIAAIALANDAVVVTRNYRDFSQVSGLNVEDWSQQDG